MLEIKKKKTSSPEAIISLSNEIKAKLPLGMVKFYKKYNGSIIKSDSKYIDLWPLDEMIYLNNEYMVDFFAPDFFIFGTDGGGMAFSIEKKTGFIYEMPFIGMSEYQKFICSDFNCFLKWIELGNI